jgi:hypothetical protein
VNDVFHVSQLKKCLREPEEQIAMEYLDVKEDLSYQEYPIKILETSERVRRVERQVSFSILPNLKDEIHFEGGRFATPYVSTKEQNLIN